MTLRDENGAIGFSLLPPGGEGNNRPRRSKLLGLALSAIAFAAPPAQAAQTIPVAAVTIYPGDIIRDGMLSERDMPDDFPGQAVTVLDRNALVGKTVRRTLLPGLPIAVNAIGEPKIITVGAQVRVSYRDGDLVITTYASALQAGAVGDTIAVRNSESGLTISGVIERDGSIRIAG